MNTPTAPPPNIRDFPEETICPSCGKFVGAYTRCPYCGCEHKRRISIRFFRYFSIIVAIVGLLLIWLAARGIEAPLIKIADIQPMHSFAYVRLEGKVTRSSAYADGGISFWLEDDTGSLQVRAYPGTGKLLLKEDRVPGPGDAVSVEGTLNFREDRVQMIVNIPEKVKITRVMPKMVAIAAISEDDLDKKVMIEGKIVATRSFKKGSSVTLKDASGSIEVVVWDTSRNLFGEKEILLTEGRNVSIRGKVGKFKEKLQLVLDFPSDINELKHEAGAGKRAETAKGEGGVSKIETGNLTRERIKQSVEVTGKVTGLRPFAKGTVLELTDPTGSVDVVIDNTLRARMPRSDEIIKVGRILKARGVVAENRNRLQVVVTSADQVEEAATPE